MTCALYPLLVLACQAILLLALAPHNEGGLNGDLTGIYGEQYTPYVDWSENDNPFDGDDDIPGPATPGAANDPVTRTFACHWVEPLFEALQPRIKARAPPRPVA